MAKFLDASGVKHFWGKITEWVNGLGISHGDIDKLTYSSPTNPDNVFDFPRISLERRSNDRTEWGLRIKNGYKYAQAGYVPILFCKMRHRNRGYREPNRLGGWVHHKTTYQSEFMRHPRVFLTIEEDDTLGMFWGLSYDDVVIFSNDRFPQCKDFFSAFQVNSLYASTNSPTSFPNLLCKTEYNTITELPVYVHTYKYNPLRRGGFYNDTDERGSRDHTTRIRSWKYEKRKIFDDAYDVPAWTLRKLEFEFKIGFCPNYFSYRNPNAKEYIKYDPAFQLQSRYFYYYSDYLRDIRFYKQYMDTTKNFPIVIDHRYKLSDCVSNIVTFKCVSSTGENVSTPYFKLVVC